jgi:hypothetical protein
MFDSQYLMLSVVFSSIGMGYFAYGKKQKKMVTLFCGIGLMTYTMFATTLLPILAVGFGLLALPFFVKD